MIHLAIKWSKIANDVQDLIAAEKIEYSMKQKIISKSTTGIGRKEFAYIKDEMKNYHLQLKEQRIQQQKQEKTETQADLRLIATPEQLIKEASISPRKKQNVTQQIQQQQQTNSNNNIDNANVGDKTAASHKKHDKHSKKKENNNNNNNNNINNNANKQGTNEIDIVSRKNKNQNMDESGNDDKSSKSVQLHSSYLRDTSNLVKKMTKSFEKKGNELSQAHVRAAFQQVCDLRKQYDTLKHTADNTEKQLMFQISVNKFFHVRRIMLFEAFCGQKTVT